MSKHPRHPADYTGPCFVSIDEIEARLRDDTPAKHVRIGESPFRAFIADLRDHSDILTFGLTIGICVGSLATVGFALIWSAS